MQAEYSALSQSLRVLLPLKRMLSELVNGIGVKAEQAAKIVARTFEDNNGALHLANDQQHSNRTKYYSCKLHHFWEHVKAGIVSIFKIDTKEQRADYLTKGLVRELFEKIRKLVQGW